MADENKKCCIGGCKARKTKEYTSQDYYNNTFFSQYLCDKHAREKGFKSQQVTRLVDSIIWL